MAKSDFNFFPTHKEKFTSDRGGETGRENTPDKPNGSP